uniref:Uncharacterized protein n=1 Tax=Coccidioides posadasii RMSCC 3488 TaxID=454284 RepID=A0A0J6F9T9_COCPO|nr:hypothetical protein CPAG_02063 [Coccidioides posadasii RMSCC 3488]
MPSTTDISDGVLLDTLTGRVTLRGAAVDVDSSDGVLLDTLTGRVTLRGAAVDVDSSDGVLLDTLGGRGTLRGDKANVKSSASRKAVWLPDPKSSGERGPIGWTLGDVLMTARVLEGQR